MAKKKRKPEKARTASFQKKDSRKIPSGFSTPVMNHFLQQNPFANLTDDQRKAFAAEISANSEVAFRESFANLERLVRAHKPTELLSTAAFYCLMKGYGPGADLTDDGPYGQS